MHESSCQMHQIQNLKSLSSGLDSLGAEVQSGLGAPSLEQLAIFSFWVIPWSSTTDMGLTRIPKELCGSCLKARRVS